MSRDQRTAAQHAPPGPGRHARSSAMRSRTSKRGADPEFWARRLHQRLASAFAEPFHFLAKALRTVAVLGLLGYGLVVGSAQSRLPALQDTMARWSGVAIRDADRCFLGIIPGSREGFTDFSDGRNAPADEKTIPITRVPQGFWDVAVALEHRSIGTWRTLPNLGVDVVSAGQALYDTASGNPRGASTLPQLVAGALLKTDHGSRRGLGWVSRKAREIAYGATLYSSYSLSASDSSNFRQLVATYLPLAQSSSSGRAGTLYGIAVSGLILFGKEPDALSLAEQAILAAAIKTHIVLAPANDPAGQRLARKIFDRVQNRAVYGLTQAYGKSDGAARRAIAAIRAMKVPHAHLCTSLQPFLPSDPADAFRASFNPVWRAQYFAEEELPQIVSELQAVAGPNFRERVQAIQLSISARENIPFKQAIRNELITVEKSAPQLSIGLVAGSARPVGDVLLTASDSQGRIRLYYQSPERPLLDVPRATGSVAKTIAALSLAQAGSPDDIYCNLRIDGTLRNADGDTGRSRCSEPGGMVSARDSFRKSMNLPIFYALGSDSVDRLHGLMGDTGFLPYPKMALRTALAFGMVYATPANMLRMMTTITKASQGQTPTARAPQIIAAMTWRDSRGTVRPPAGRLDLSPYLSGEAPIHFVTSVLSAPLELGGTAAALTACEDRMAWRFAKTGTVAQAGHVASKLLLASGQIHGQSIAMIGVIGTVADSGDISPISTRTLAKAICTGLSAQDNDS